MCRNPTVTPTQGWHRVKEVYTSVKRGLHCIQNLIPLGLCRAEKQRQSLETLHAFITHCSACANIYIDCTYANIYIDCACILDVLSTLTVVYLHGPFFYRRRRSFWNFWLIFPGTKFSAYTPYDILHKCLHFCILNKGRRTIKVLGLGHPMY
jgi:hypothetical protein